MKLHPLDVFNDDVDSLLNGIGISEDIRVSVAQFQQLLCRIVDHINFQHKLREILKNNSHHSPYLVVLACFDGCTRSGRN